MVTENKSGILNKERNGLALNYPDKVGYEMIFNKKRFIKKYFKSNRVQFETFLDFQQF